LADRESESERELTEDSALAAVFPTCVVSALCPKILEDTVSVLGAAGIEASITAPYSCCGQPAYSAGKRPEAGRLASVALDHLSKTSSPIVVPSGSCAAMIKKVWPRLFERTPRHEQAVLLARRTFELTQFLEAKGFSPAPAEDGETESEGRSSGTQPSLPKKVTVHDSCHGARGLGIGPQCRSLLKAAGYQISECEDPGFCCGFGGVFSAALPEVSVAIGQAKVEMLRRASYAVVGTDPACLIHLATVSASAPNQKRKAGAPPAEAGSMRFYHIAELLAAAVAGREPPVPSLRSLAESPAPALGPSPTRLRPGADS
jgi:L-lactate dehydrogenase complex protein LldE